MQSCKVLVASEANLGLRSLEDIPELVGQAMYTDGLILTEQDLGEAFFNLRSGLAGEAFQKFTNYHICVAIVLKNHMAYGQRFSELALEHKRHNRIRFVNSIDEAMTWLCTRSKL